jgi:hypothetical protein
MGTETFRKTVLGFWPCASPNAMTLAGFTWWTRAPSSVLPPEWLSSTNSSPRTSNLHICLSEVPW